MILLRIANSNDKKWEDKHPNWNLDEKGTGVYENGKKVIGSNKVMQYETIKKMKYRFR